MQSLVERLTGIRFRNSNHVSHAMFSLTFFAAISWLAVVQWQLGFLWLWLGLLHCQVMCDAAVSVRRGKRRDAFSPDCIWFNGVMASANLGMFAVLVWSIHR